MHHRTDRIMHSTVFVAPVVEYWLERKTAKWIHHEGSFRPPRSCAHIKMKEGRNEMFYLTTHSTYFIYCYMVSDIWLRTTQIAREETRCRHMGNVFRLAASVLLYASSHRQDNAYHSICCTSRGILAGTRNSSMDHSVHSSHHEQTLYHVATTRSCANIKMTLCLCRSVVETPTDGDLRLMPANH